MEPELCSDAVVVEGNMKPELYEAVVERKSLKEGFASSELLKVTRQENTILHVAVQAYALLSYIGEICDLCPSLIGRANLDGDTPLHIAARGGRHGLVQQLISKFEDIENGGSSSTLLEMLNSKKDTALHEALKNYHLFDGYRQLAYLKVVKTLISKDPQLSNLINGAGESPVFIAAREGLLDFLNAVLNPYCSEYGGPTKMTALHAAVLLGEGGENKGVKDFISDLKGKKGERETALEIMETLISRKPELIKVEDDSGRTPLHYAANLHSDGKIKNSHERVKMLLDSEKNLLADSDILSDRISVVYHQDKNGMTALHYAALRGNKKSVEAMIQKFPDSVEQVDKRGWTTLHFVVRSRNYSTLEFITYDAKVRNISTLMANKSDTDGNTPLHLAAKISNLDALRFLMNICQVDKRARNKDNLTALDIVKAKTIDDVLEKKTLIYSLSSKTGKLSSQAPKFENGDQETKDPNNQAPKFENGDQETKDPNNEGRVPKKKNEDVGQVREIQLLVAALIATVSFAATFTMPGGYHSDGPDQGMATLSTKAGFVVFAISNTLAMTLSTSAIFIHFNVTTTNIVDFSTDKAAKFIILANFGMLVAFVTSTYLVLANNRPLAISTAIVGCLFFLVAVGKIFSSFWKYCMDSEFLSTLVARIIIFLKESVFKYLLCCPMLLLLPCICISYIEYGEEEPEDEGKPLQSSVEDTK